MQPVGQESPAVVLAFTRLPVPGQVKTRLAAGVGPEHAAALYEILLRSVLDQASRCNSHKSWSCFRRQH